MGHVALVIGSVALVIGSVALVIGSVALAMGTVVLATVGHGPMGSNTSSAGMAANCNEMHKRAEVRAIMGYQQSTNYAVSDITHAHPSCWCSTPAL